MEKIVQVGFDMPRSQQADLDKVLFTGLNEIIEGLGPKVNFEQDRWRSIFFDGLQPLLNTLRKVRRFLSSFSFHVGLFSTSEVMEVNFVDLVALEAIRTFEPDLYHSLAQNREIVFWIGANSGLINRGNNNQENHKKEINDWLGKSSEENRNATAKIATRLFPQIEWTLSGSQHGMGFEKGWLRGLRICHPEVFERYFSFGIPDGDVPQSFIKKLIDVSGDTSQLKELLLELDDHEKIAATLQRLRVFAKDIPFANAKTCLLYTSDAADE